MFQSLKSKILDLVSLFSLPGLTLHLRADQAEENDPYYGKLIRAFYASTRRWHPRYRVLRDLAWGVALQPMDRQEHLEDSARRNQRKALRNGYRVERIDFNGWLADIQAIRRSTEIRQGPVDPSLTQDEVKPVTDPRSLNAIHDYPFFGVRINDRLVAYAGCLVAGEVAMIEHILGHADHQDQGIVPLLILGMKEEIGRLYPGVRWYGYGMWFGAGPSLRRFKKKMGFRPFRVKWVC